MTGLFITVPNAEAAHDKQNTLALKGLEKVNLHVSLSKDANASLKITASHPDRLRADLARLVKKRLGLVGISVVSDARVAEQKENTSMIVGAALDHSGSIYLKLSLEERVSLVRSPDSVLVLTTWSLLHDPRSNEDGPIKNAVMDMMDVFVAEYLQANPDKKN